MATSSVPGAMSRRMSPPSAFFAIALYRVSLSNRKRDHVGQHDSQRSADESNGESFGEELQQNVSAARAQRLFHSDLSRPLRHRDQHDVHQADAANAQRQRADEAQQNFQADGDDFELVNLFHEVKYAHRAAIGCD